MTIEESMQALTRFCPVERLRDILRVPLEYLPEDAVALLPSLILSGDGPALQGLILSSAAYLCDVSISPVRNDFDYIPKATICNYRFSTWAQEIKAGDAVVETFELAQIQLVHTMPLGTITTITYAGHGRDKWMQDILQAVPVATMLPSTRPLKR